VISLKAASIEPLALGQQTIRSHDFHCDGTQFMPATVKGRFIEPMLLLKYGAATGGRRVAVSIEVGWLSRDACKDGPKLYLRSSNVLLQTAGDRSCERRHQ